MFVDYFYVEQEGSKAIASMVGGEKTYLIDAVEHRQVVA